MLLSTSIRSSGTKMILNAYNKSNVALSQKQLGSLVRSSSQYTHVSSPLTPAALAFPSQPICCHLGITRMPGRKVSSEEPWLALDVTEASPHQAMIHQPLNVRELSSDRSQQAKPSNPFHSLRFCESVFGAKEGSVVGGAEEKYLQSEYQVPGEKPSSPGPTPRLLLSSPTSFLLLNPAQSRQGWPGEVLPLLPSRR